MPFALIKVFFWCGHSRMIFLVEFAGKLFHVRRSQKWHNRCWPLIGHKIIFCAQTQTCIRMSHGIASLREATQGLACSLLKTFTAILPDPTDCPLVSEDVTFHETFLIFCGVSRKEATKFLKVQSALLRSGSLQWLVYVFNRSFQQTFVGEGLRDEPKERLCHLCVGSY